MPCIPGAQLLSVDGDEFTGTVKVKVGPITAQYKERSSFQAKDASARRAVIKADGKEARGQGNASAVVTAELKDEGDHTSCVLTTDLTISGKAAQFRCGVLSDVAIKLIGQFAERLEADLLAGSAAASPTDQAPQAPTAAPHTDNAASVDLLSVAAVPVAKHVLPVVGGLVVGVAIGYLLGRRR